MACANSNGEMQFHEAANIFPLDDDNIAALADDIRQHGQQVAIELMDGQVLDGRRRWLACKMAGIKPVTREVVVADPIAYAWSLNGARRHLSQTQLAMAGAEMRKLYNQQAKERQKLSQGRGQKGPANLPDLKGDSRDAVGELVGVSGKLIDAATLVLKNGTPSLVSAVKADRLAVSTASRAAHMSPTEQDALAERALANTAKRRPRIEDSDDARADEKPEGERRGVGIIKANEAINCLIRIPKNDALRKRGFQLVTDWIRKNP